MKILKLITISALLLSGSSCSKFLDVSDELAGGLTSNEEVFNNPSYTRRWYANVFGGIPDYSRVFELSYDNGVQNPWTSMADELYTGTAGGLNNSGLYSEWNAGSDRFHRWVPLYNLIRQANIFLENAHSIPASGTNADYITEEDIDWYLANVRFMRAYYHYLLFEQYGPIPILDRSLVLEDELDLERRPVDEVLAFIDSELESAAQDMHQGTYHDQEDFRAVPTKGVALAVRAKLWMYAASPLFNGEYSEALNLTTSDGAVLFPDKDDSKWNKALAACKDFIEFAESGNYQLYKAYTDQVLDPDKSVYELFQVYNPEIIWATTKTGWGGMDGNGLERRSTPISEPNGQGDIAVLQELVDDFAMKDGLPINDRDYLGKSTLYSEEGKSPYDGIEVDNMFIDREPRFYNTVFFSGRRWHISNNEVRFHSGGNADRTHAYYPISGHLLYKRFNRTVHKRTPGVTSRFRPSYIFRLAEFYLLYAEAMNEVNPTSPDILKYVNLVRERAGIPALEDLNPAIAGNQELQREAIRMESRIELATEGQRYFDVRRWMIAENEVGKGGQGGNFSGMNATGNQETFAKRTKVHDRVFKRKNYLFPIPLVEIQKSPALVQNPGW
ncbi:MAG: RagB/SusD family nutrient uptake outer membrane protein [Sphingobacterium sp.]